MLLHRERGMSRMNVPLTANIHMSFRRNDRNAFARQLCNIEDHTIA